jgi:hypothetical protein
MQESFDQHYFKELCKHWKVKGITLKEGLLKWKQSQIYVPIRRLHMRIMLKEHDVPMAGHHGEKATRMVIEKEFTSLK